MENKIALVTGGSRGIGRAIALQLARDGYNIIIGYNKNKEESDSVVEEIEKIGREASSVQADLSSDEGVYKLVREVSEITERLQLLVNNAGFDYAKLIEDYTIEEMRYVMELVLISKMTLTKLVLPLLKKVRGSSIINIASRMGKEKTIKTIGAYGPAEAGVIKYTQCCALEFSDYKIRVNCVAPGLIRTDLTEKIISESDFDSLAKANPTGRIGDPQDIADAVSFLVSSKASYINGETIGVNGGSNLG